ncbi:MAG: prefoldin subunit [Candidatus Odinarchaeota archaeon]
MVIRDIPPALQEQLRSYETMRQQVNLLREQINVFERSNAELKATLKAIEDKSDDEELYRQVGLIMFKDKASKVKKDLTERLEITALQLNSLKKQSENLTKKLKEKEKELTSQMGGTN